LRRPSQYDIDFPGDILRSEGLPNPNEAKEQLVCAEKEVNLDGGSAAAERLIAVDKIRVLNLWSDSMLGSIQLTKELNELLEARRDRRWCTLGLMALFLSVDLDFVVDGFRVLQKCKREDQVH